MKITAVYGAMPNYDGELSRVLKIVNDTLAELEVEVESVNLAYAQIPYFDGINAAAAENIMRNIESADGVIFATTAMLYGVSSIMSTFIEYFLLSEYEEILRGKNCMVVVTSYASDDRYVLETFSRVLNKFGAFDAVKIGLSPELAKTLEREDTSEIITRQAEDFYRAVRQNRKFFISRDVVSVPAASVAGLSQNQYETLLQMEKRQKLDISDVYAKFNLNSMTSKQEKDVSEISQILSKKYSSSPEHKPSAILQAPFTSAPMVSRSKTCKQMTQSMPHYFQPQIAAGFSAVIQINITGAEKFESHIQIINSECQYNDGAAETPDITILSDTTVWTDVLTGKCSAQKAFMIGKLKVRGNFVVLTKLEQLFKPMT